METLSILIDIMTSFLVNQLGDVINKIQQNPRLRVLLEGKSIHYVSFVQPRFLAWTLPPKQGLASEITFSVLILQARDLPRRIGLSTPVCRRYGKVPLSINGLADERSSQSFS